MSAKMTGRVALVVGLGAAALFTSGCAAAARDMVKEGRAAVVVIPTDGVYISKAGVYQRGNETVISGRLRTQRGTSWDKEDHMDAAAYSPDGELVAQVSAAPNPPVDLRHRGHVRREFVLHLPGELPAGVTVRLAYHKGTTSEAAFVSCGGNTALQ